MQNLTVEELTQLSKNYDGGLKGIIKDLKEVVQAKNEDNHISSKTKHFAKIDLATAEQMLKEGV